MATWYLNGNLATGLNNGTSPANAWQTLGAVVVTSFANNDTLLIMGYDYSLQTSYHTPNGNGPTNRPTTGCLAMNTGKSGITFLIDPLSTQPAIFTSLDAFFPNGCTIDGLIPGTYTAGKYNPTIQMIKARGFDGYNGTGGGTIVGTATVNIRGSTNYTLRGIEVDQSMLKTFVDDYNTAGTFAQIHGISVSTAASTGLVVEYCYVHGVIGDCISADYANGTNTGYANTSFTTRIFRYNYLLGCNDDLIQGASNMSVYGNYMDGAGYPALHGGHPDAWQLGDDSSYVDTYGNVIVNTGQMPFYSLVEGEVRIRDNIILSTRTAACGFAGPGQSAGSVLSQAGATGGGAGWQSPPFGNFLYSNNLSYSLQNGGTFSGSSTWTQVSGNVLTTVGLVNLNCKFGAPTSMSTAFGPDSLWWDYAGVQYYDVDGNPAAKSSTPLYNTALNSDPLLVSPGTYDFHPKAGSPLIGIAPNLTSMLGPCFDFDGNPRPSVGNWTAGPFEGSGGTGAIPFLDLSIFTKMRFLIGQIGTQFGVGIYGSPAGHTSTGVTVMRAEPGTYTINVTNLPPGLAYDSARGNITGTPTTQGTWLVNLQALSGITVVENVNILMPIRTAAGGPAVASDLFVNGAVGTPLKYKTQGTFGFTNNAATITYTFSGLPPGITQSGAILSGTPTSGGIYPVAVTVTNTNGTGTATVTFTISGTGSTTPPNPNPSTIASASAIGSSSITVTATTAVSTLNPPVEYAFSKDNGSTFSAFQSSPTFVWTGLTPNTAYNIVVKAEDSAGPPNVTTPSAATIVTTLPAPVVNSFIIDSSGSFGTLGLNQSVQIGVGGSGGLALSLTGGAITATYSSGAPGSNLIFTFNRSVRQFETGTFTYTNPGNGFEDISGTDLANKSSTTAINNSTVPPLPTRPGHAGTPNILGGI